MKKVGFVFILLAVAVISLTAFSVSVESYALSGEDISISFTNKSVEITPIKTNNGYTLEYIPDMIINISGSISSDINARSDTTITQDGKVVNAIYKAGIYEVTVSVYPSSGGDFIFKTFQVEVTKKEISDIRFDTESVNITYLDELSPKLLLDPLVEANTNTSFVYYADIALTNEIEKPLNVGEYWVEARVTGDNYEGTACSKVTISKNRASIEILRENPEITYSSEDAKNGGYSIIDVLGVKIANTEFAERHELKTYIKSGEDYVEQTHILLPNVYEYKIAFASEENYTASPLYGTIVLNKADTHIVSDNGIIVPYSLDFDALQVAKSSLNKDSGYKIINENAQTVVSEINENQILISFFDLDGNELGYLPQNVGKYAIKAEFIGNDFYNSCSLDNIPFEITKRNIASEIHVFGEQNFAYGQSYDVENLFTIPEEYSANKTFEYKKVDADNQVLQELDEKPTMPGRFMAVLKIEEENYFGTKILIFSISKLSIPESAISVDNLEYTYGDSCNISVEVESQYEIETNQVTLAFFTSNGKELSEPPVYAGSYLVEIRIENDIYTRVLRKNLSIAKKDIFISAKDREVSFGNALFSKDENNAYKADDFLIDGLVSQNDIESVLSSITVYVGSEGYVTNNMNLVVGSYEMRLSGENANYNVIDAGCGSLKITKRLLTVKTSSIKQYVGYSYSPSITVDNSVYNDIAENMVFLFEVFYTAENGTPLSSSPSVAGVYNIGVRVKAENIDCAELKNYQLNLVGGTLTLLSNQKSDKEGLILLEGKFDINTELVVKTVTANENVEKAVEKIDKNYEVSKLYYIQYTFNTVDDSRFVLKLNRKDIDLSNAKVMIAYNTDDFSEVEYTVQGDYIVLRLDNMASYYAICTQKTLPLLWIIVIAVVVGLVIAGVGVFLWIYFTGANVKARKNDVTLSNAVTATKGVKTEDEEFDELLETFDESTVEKHEDPAKRISREALEAEREQYRLYLRRMRASADKNASDKLSEMGLNSDFDEEKAIDQLIEEDRKKRLKKEQDEAKRKAEESKRKQEETSFTINERKSGTLSGGAVVPKNNNIDDDIDF